uniref:Long-chain acyl-CoA synthetase n=1 Tax=Streptomyces auratus AGR0001 TaxID=1160718 RepID=J1SD80_9ACTN
MPSSPPSRHSPGLRRTGLQAPDQLAEREGDHEIEQPGDQDRGQALVLIERVPAEVGQFELGEGQPQQIHQRGILGQQDQFVGQRRQHDTERLRNDDGDHRPPVRHSQRTRRLRLPLGHRLNSGPDGLGHVRRAHQPERQHHRDVHIERDLEGQRHTETERDEHQQTGDPAEEFDIGDGDPAVGRHGRQPHQREHQTECEAEAEAEQGVEDGIDQRRGDDLGKQRLGDLDIEERHPQLVPVGDQREDHHGDDQDAVLHAADDPRALSFGYGHGGRPQLCGVVPNHFL